MCSLNGVIQPCPPNVSINECPPSRTSAHLKLLTTDMINLLKTKRFRSSHKPNPHRAVSRRDNLIGKIVLREARQMPIQPELVVLNCACNQKVTLVLSVRRFQDGHVQSFSYRAGLVTLCIVSLHVMYSMNIISCCALKRKKNQERRH